MICSTAGGLLDYKPTPLTSISPYPSGEIHATVLSNLLAGRQVLSVPSTVLWPVTFVLVFGLCVLFLSRPLWLGLFACGAAGAALVLADRLLFTRWDVQFELVPPLTGVLMAGITSATYRLVMEYRDKVRAGEGFLLQTEHRPSGFSRAERTVSHRRDAPDRQRLCGRTAHSARAES